MQLTNYRKFMVEKYYSFEPVLSIEDFCKNHSRIKIKVEEFEKWLSLYENTKTKTNISSTKLIKKDKKKKSSSYNISKITKDEYIDKLKKERNHKTHLNQIRYLKKVVREGKISFSKDSRKNKQRIKMFLENDNPYKIYKLASILAENLHDSEYKIELLLKELKKNHIVIPKEFFNYQFTNKNSISIESNIEETKDESPVVFEINPKNNNTITVQNEIVNKEDLQSFCKKSVNDLQKALVGIYKLMESM